MYKALIFLFAFVVSAMPSHAELRYSEATAPTSLNPFLVRDMPSLRASELVFEGLVSPPDAGKVQPLLAEKWEIAPDGMSITFKLKKNVKWHDGEPLTAEDVVFTVNAGKDPRSETFLKTQFETFAGAEALNERTVKLEFSRRVPNPLFYAGFKILPAHLHPEGYVKDELSHEKIIGTGPFVFEKWASSGDIRFTANKNYHEDNQPNIEAVEVTPVPDDNIRNDLLRYNAVDLVPKVRPRDIPSLEELGGVRLYPYSTLSYAFIGINMRNPALRDHRVRKALALALDRTEMLKAHYGNRGSVISGPFPPASWAYNSDVAPWPFSVEKAASLLDDAEIKDNDRDGVREYGGKPFSLKFVSLAQSEVQKAVVLDIQQQLKNIGVIAEIQFFEPLSWKKAVFEDHDFDLVLTEWTFDHSVNIYTLFHSTQAGANGNNIGGYANSTVDRLLEESRSAENSEVLRASYGELHRVLHEDLPYIFLWGLNRYAAVSSRISNVRLHPFYFFTYVGDWSEK